MNRHRLVAAASALALAVVGGSCGSDATGPQAIRIRFVDQPVPVVAGSDLSVSVEFLDADGARMSGVRDVVTLTLTGLEQAPTWTTRANSGIAVFDDVAIQLAGSALALRATAGSLSAVSLPFTVAPAGPSADESSIEIDGTDLVSNTPVDVVITLRDAFANPLPGVSLSVAAPGATFSPASGTTTANGTFTTVVRAAPGQLNITVTTGGTAFSHSPALTVDDACAATPVVVPGQFGGALTQGAGCVIQNRPHALRTFTVGAAAGVTFEARPTFPGGFEVRANPAEPTIEFFVTDSAAIEWLLPAGTYQFRMAATDGSGAWEVTSRTGPGTGGQNAKMLVAPGAYTGQALTTDDLFDGLWYSDMFFFADPRPCTINLSSQAFDAYLFILNGLTGSLISATDGGGEGTDAQVTRPSCLSTGGPIGIVPTSLFPNEVGPYTLTITLHDQLPGSADARPAMRTPVQLTPPRR